MPTFQIMRTEITLGMWRACMAAGACADNVWPSRPSNTCNHEVFGDDNYPVNAISWPEGNAFTAWVGAQLPPESEWEFAARNRGQDVTFPWGETNDCGYANMLMYPTDELTYCTLDGERSGAPVSLPVCSYAPQGNTEQGLCDMIGNVEEWTQDEHIPGYSNNYELHPDHGSAYVGNGEGSHHSRSGACNTHLNTRKRASGISLTADIPRYGARLARDMAAP